jgi:hypothetical protein
MDPLYSVIIYSKYSPNSKKLFDMIEQSGVDITNKIQLLCIDNNKVRQRIKNNKQIEVTSVPCILSVFSNGGVEKYDSSHAFAWIENFIQRFAPPPPPPAPPIYNPPPPPSPSLPKNHKSEDEDVQHIQKRKPKIPRRMQLIKDVDQLQATSIDDLPMEDTDRHRNIPQPKRIRQDEGNYVEDEELFSGEVVDNNREPSNVVRSNAANRRNSPDPSGIKARADELARGRDDMDKSFANPNKRPMEDRRP